MVYRKLSITSDSHSASRPVDMMYGASLVLSFYSLANGLRLLFLMNCHTDGEIPILPTTNEILVAGQNVEEFAKFGKIEFEVDPDSGDSFFPLAELYMGMRAKEIPIKMRTLNLSNNTNSRLK